MQQKQGAQQGDAPRQAMIAGQPHMLAYINEAERQMLKRAGGAEAPGPAGIPAYWKLFEPSTWGDGKGFEGFTSSSSSSGPSTDVYQGPNIDASSGYTVNDPIVTELDTGWLTDDNTGPAYTLDGGVITDAGQTITNPDGSIITLDAQKEKYPRNYMPDNGMGNTTTGTSSTTTTKTGGGGTSVVTAPPVNQALLDAQARRAAALAQQMGAVATAFGFSTDDYYNQLGTDYREGGLSEAFTTAYDDAIRGIYDVYKSAGMLTQSDVDDDLGILAGANSGEEGRMDSIVDQYTTANRNYVTEGRGGIEGELQGFVTETEDIPTIDAQTASILAYDVPGKSQPYKTPQEAEVVDFFTNFVKRAYDPSYNVDPTALASGGPKKVSGSVDQLGAGTQPSTIAGILDPVKGGSVKVVG